MTKLEELQDERTLIRSKIVRLKCAGSLGAEPARRLASLRIELAEIERKIASVEAPSGERLERGR